MFESLSDRLSKVFRSFGIGGMRQLSADNITDALREVRLALLEADVNYAVVKDFVDRIKDKCIGQELTKKLTPSQHVIKIVNDELTELLGSQNIGLNLSGAEPHIVMLVGLQGSGKTTTAGKLANLLRKQKLRPYLVPVDIYRPAAILQLQTIAKQLDLPCFASDVSMKPSQIAKEALVQAREQKANLIIFDTAGRLHIDEPLMQELSDLKAILKPRELLFVADAMTGQEAVNVAKTFNDRLNISGVVLTKMDGDARGGAALSIKAVTGAAVKFVGLGEKLSDLEIFHPERVAGRILGMGDMVSLIEKAQETIDLEEAEALAKKMQKAKFDLEDFRVQMRRVKQIGSMESILKMIPGLGGLTSKLKDVNLPEKELAKTEAIINSMTMKERHNPEILNGSRKMRIAKGCGMQIGEVNLMLKQFEQMRKMMQQMSTNKMPNLGGMGGLGSLGGMAGLGGGSTRQGPSPTKKKRDIKKERAKRKNKKR